MLYINPGETNHDSVVNSKAWTDEDGVLKSNVVNTGEAVPTGTTGFAGADLVRRVIGTWYKPYKDFYLEKPEWFGDEEYGERGIQFLVRDEVVAGAFNPRYKIKPAIDNMDWFQCGYFKVLQTEWREKDPAPIVGATWDHWAYDYQYFANSQLEANTWNANHASIKDMLLWIGSAIFIRPQSAFRHLYAVKVGYYATTADVAPSAHPVAPFTYQFFWHSAAFTATGWNDVESGYYGYQYDTLAAQQDYEHDVTIEQEATKIPLLFPLEYPDPWRPYRMKFANIPETMINAYEAIMDQAANDWGAIFTNKPYPTVPVTPDVGRYMSKYRILALTRPPKTYSTPGPRNVDRRYEDQKPPSPNPSPSPRPSPGEALLNSEREWLDVLRSFLMGDTITQVKEWIGATGEFFDISASEARKLVNSAIKNFEIDGTENEAKNWLRRQLAGGPKSGSSKSNRGRR
jgi:hypothetical protein